LGGGSHEISSTSATSPNTEAGGSSVLKKAAPGAENPVKGKKNP
jgi:hypothetical protein